MTKIPMTHQGYEKLKAELDHLKNHERPRIISAIAEARSHGDLRENAEYHAAKEQQGFIEGRIRDIESKLSLCNVIQVDQIQNEGKVIFGATVTLMNTENDSQVIYQIVGDDEADIKHKKISVSSPIARAMIGKFEGDEVVVKTAHVETFYEILKVEYI